MNYRFGLLSVIALQLLQAVARRAVYFCAECKNPFIRLGGPKSERRPKSGVNSFCKQCGHRAAVRQAAAKYRAANRARHAAAASHADANQDADAPPELIL
jgi:DNA-directed RNA polymerase subunit RPC12/RpoP